jgi:hypothetical protein
MVALALLGCGRTDVLEPQESTLRGTKRINVWCPEEFPRFPGDSATCRVAGAPRGIIIRNVTVRDIPDRDGGRGDEAPLALRVGKPFGFRCPDTFPASTTDVAVCTCEEQLPGPHAIRRARLQAN